MYDAHGRQEPARMLAAWVANHRGAPLVIEPHNKARAKDHGYKVKAHLKEDAARLAVEITRPW